MDSVNMSSLLLAEEDKIRTELKADSAIDQNRRQSVDRLNEVLDMLGLPYNPAGQFVGWIDEAYEGSKHGHVDFGLSEVYLEDEMETDRDELGNPEPRLWLDFKVDGEIWDKIPLVKKQMR